MFDFEMSSINARQLFVEDPFAEVTGYWWLFLLIVSILNILVSIGYLVYIRNQPKTTTSYKAIACGGVYVLVCAWRSMFPIINTSRTCFWDTDFATPVVNRSIATVSELCLIVIFTIIYYKVWKEAVEPVTGALETSVLISIVCLVPVIAVAQVFAWLGVATTNNIYNAIEVIIWTLMFTFLMLLSGITLVCYKPERQSVVKLLVMTALFSLGFVLFEAIIDIPRYLDDFNNLPGNYSSFLDGTAEMGSCQIVSRTLDTWERDIAWQTGYFTLGVWWCMILVAWNQAYDLDTAGAVSGSSTSAPPLTESMSV